jgi:hypothetical protein
MTDTRSLSLGQESLWTLHRIAPDSAAHNGAGAGWISPAPDPRVLARAVEAVVSRHDMLRSVFTQSGGEPRRIVRGPELAGLDVRDVPGAGEAELADEVVRAARAPYRLAETGPFRAVLFRRAGGAALLVGTHHVAADATSHGLIWRDLIHAFEAYAAGRFPEWDGPPALYEEYVARERRLVDSSRGARMAAYWRELCAGAVPAEFPTDLPRPAWPAFRAGTEARRLPQRLVAGLRAAADAVGVSPFAFLTGVFQALLYRYTAWEDFAIVSPATTRRAAMRDVVGHFANLLVLRARFDRSTTLVDAVRAASDQVRRGISNAAYPYLSLAPETGGRPAPPFRIAVVLVTADRFGSLLDRTFDGETVESTGLRASHLDVPRLEPGCDLSLEVVQCGASVTVQFRYDAELFRPETIERMCRHFVEYATLAVADPGQAVARLGIPGDAGRRPLTLVAERG